MRQTPLLATVVGLFLAGPAVAQSGVLSFAPRVDFPVSGTPFAIVTDDFNGDGDADVATADYDTDGVSVLLGDGRGSFIGAGAFPADIGPAAIQSADLSGDGVPDLVVANELANTVSVLLGVLQCVGDCDGDGAVRINELVSGVNIALENSPISACPSFDVNSSSQVEINELVSAVGDALNGCRGKGAFEAPRTTSVGLSPESVAVARFDADDHLDVATADLFDDTVSILLGRGDGTFGDRQAVSVDGGPFGVAAGRIDADATVDLAVSASDAGVVTILFGNGDGMFRTGGSYEVGITPEGLVVVDLDGDGDRDVAVANEDSDSVSVLLGNGDGTFAAAVSYAVGGFPTAVAVGDFNGDQVLDLASADSFGTAELDNSVSVLLGNGDGTFGSAQSFEVGISPYSLVAADFSGDGLADIVSANVDGDNVSLLVNRTGE